MRLCLNEAKLEKLDPRTVDCCYHIHRRVASPALVSKHLGQTLAGPGLVSGALFNSFTLCSALGLGQEQRH